MQSGNALLARGLVLFLFAITMIFGDSKPEEELKQITRRNRLWRKRLEETLKQGVRLVEIRNIDVGRVAEIFHQLQMALVIAPNRSGSRHRYDRISLETAIDIFISGIRKEPSG